MKEENHIHEKQVEHTSEFLLGNYLSTWKRQLFINLKNNYSLKKLLKWADIKCNTFNIYNVIFL